MSAKKLSAVTGMASTILVLIAGIFSFLNQPFLVRAVIITFCLVSAVVLFFFTRVGAQLLIFLKEARIELRKVVWPSRQETMQTTLLVMAIVLVMAIFLWGLDSLFLWLIGWLTGSGS